MTKNLDYYVSLPYPVLLTPVHEEDGGGWYAEILLLPGCMSDGKTPNEAIDMVHDSMLGWLEMALESGTLIAEPEITDYAAEINTKIDWLIERERSKKKTKV